MYKIVNNEQEDDIELASSLKVAQYRQIWARIEAVPEATGSTINEIVKNSGSSLLCKQIVIRMCVQHDIPVAIMFDGVDIDEFLSKHRLALDIVDTPTPQELLEIVTTFIKGNFGRPNVLATHAQMIVDASNLFESKYDMFRCEKENEKLLQEVTLERLKYETVNKRQLAIMARNTSITLVGVAMTALLTVINIIVTVLTSKKDG